MHFSGVGGGVQKILFSKEGGNETDTFFPERGGGVQGLLIRLFFGRGGGSELLTLSRSAPTSSEHVRNKGHNFSLIV